MGQKPEVKSMATREIYSENRFLSIPSSWMLRLVALVRTDVSEERIASIIRVTRIGELRITLAAISSVLRLLVKANVVPSSQIFVTLMIEALCSSETSVLTSHKASHPRRRYSSSSLPLNPQILHSINRLVAVLAT
jgi:hypothetical protein